MPRQLSKTELIERSIIKKYRKEIWNPFIRGIQEYSLVNDGDRIAVYIDGSAQSFLCAKLMQQLKRVSDTDFYAEFFADEGLIPLCGELGIPAETAKASFEENGFNKVTDSACMSDAAEELLGGILYGGVIKTLMPSENGDGIKIIKPIYCVKRDAVNAWVKYNTLCFEIQRQRSDNAVAAGKLIEKMKAVNPHAERNIFRSIHAVCLDTMPGFCNENGAHSFLESY